MSEVWSMDWYLVPLQYDCRHCGTQADGYGLVLGPNTQVSQGTTAENWDVDRLGTYGAVCGWKRAGPQRCEFITAMSEGRLRFTKDELLLACEHCGGRTGLGAVAPTAMENFVQWGSLRAMRNERRMIVAKGADIAKFHDGTVIDFDRAIGPSFAVVARGACHNDSRGQGRIEILLDLAAGHYAWSTMFGNRGSQKAWSTLSAVSGRQIATMVEQLALAEIDLTSLGCIDDAGPVCRFAFEQIVNGLMASGYACDAGRS
ncbi:MULTISPECIES: hypothetical protein [Phyllobacteriaceae]|uniref:Uncharacterized protein n=2 Tax=Mesorhizobium hungaricum TaxID=1566387 RepID=A0A1C2E7D1_9HYPH|nr:MULTISPECIES: hypothetical protein [Mesorhizobium]MBN9237251.1 hypothetical protein [Mesorhizobium sp.]MDQ0333171.1 hypothetical protein [Mesorhizobium sp. YL-MeA3-2017]OCX22891.1 hypothetical protein QV13_05470 [Mesorhizobium hungaricum]